MARTAYFVVHGADVVQALNLPANVSRSSGLKCVQPGEHGHRRVAAPR